MHNPQPAIKGVDNIEDAKEYIGAGYTAGSNHGLASACYNGAVALLLTDIAVSLRKLAGRDP